MEKDLSVLKQFTAEELMEELQGRNGEILIFGGYFLPGDEGIDLVIKDVYEDYNLSFEGAQKKVYETLKRIDVNHDANKDDLWADLESLIGDILDGEYD